MMQTVAGKSVRSKMEELRLVCDKEISIQRQRMQNGSCSFQTLLQSIKSDAQETLLNQGKLAKLKGELREAEDTFVKALAVKTRKEAKKMAMADSLAATKARTEELKRNVEDQMTRRDECAAIISNQSKVLAEWEENVNKVSESREEIEEAISWYNRVLGFRVECGCGVKFVFTSINPKNPKEEYSFILHHVNDTYTLLDCHPQVSDMEKLIQELNSNNSLFKFVRTMRGRFQEASACGDYPQIASLPQESTPITASAPVSSVSNDSRTESPANHTLSHPGESDKFPRKVKRATVRKSTVSSPASALYQRQSLRSSRGFYLQNAD